MEKYTWGQIQLETLRKMFLNKDALKVTNLKTMRTENRYKTYLDGMAQAANEGIAEILKRSKPYIKTIDLTVRPLTNLMTDIKMTYHDGSADEEYECEGGLSYYYEIDGKATVKLYVNDVLITTTTGTATVPGKFTSYKGFITNPSAYTVKIVFSGVNPYYYRRLAVYEEDYNTLSNSTTTIPDYKEYQSFDLKELVTDYYKIYKVYYEDTELVNNTNYQMEDSHTINLGIDGCYRIKYQCFPLWIDEDADDDSEFELDNEIVILLPLYMASQLYKDDNISMATMYRNEFEAALEDAYKPLEDLKFTSKSGWL